ncbi:hypothetical protein G7068_16165 [Leucobacter viscericola]|uniref:Major tail protein n=1 Tax=Leucobacter viscericola TaxID=2714935 RepID=A0A6G7XJ91_9MICO|nr:hypothetical protein [Leucobacter viscericola]QIK61800.1 hypothetical protein G7068_00175 [Leucobacter viscericola]QIK64582.1 hypothetical protein G7068_16165 [Leucobacter viscericola]
MSDRVLRGNETVLLIPAYVDPLGNAQAIHSNGLTPLTSDGLTTTALNHWIPVTSSGHPNASGGGNVSCAVKDDMTLGLTDSEADTDRVICDVGQVEELTTKQFEAAMTGFRDKDLTANGAYNLFNKLTFAPDVPYIIAHRIGVKQTELAVVGERWDYYLVGTDVQIPAYANGANITVGQTFIPKNIVQFAAELTA